MSINYAKTPFPWFGGKSKAAPNVWALLGDVDHYCEPFAGSLAVLLNRPHPCNRAYFSETVNDLDGFVVNFWRAVQGDPQGVARAGSWPVSEADKSARQIALLRWRDETGLGRLAGDPDYFDAGMAGWWVWAVSVQIGAFDGRGPWTADPVTGRIVKQPRGVTREPGVGRGLPHISDNGQGVNHAGLREPGVTRDLPFVGNDGRGVIHAGLREPGVTRDLPHLTNAGQGVNRPQLREPGVSVDEAAGDEETFEFHPIVMPEMRRWMAYLSARLRHVRILNGDWSRLVTRGASMNLSARKPGGCVGIFLDPPYDEGERQGSIYMQDQAGVAGDVYRWCVENGGRAKTRIVLAGFEGEHDKLADHGWTVHEWFTQGWLAGGMGNVGGTGTHQMGRERLWASPACITPRVAADDEQLAMFA